MIRSGNIDNMRWVSRVFEVGLCRLRGGNADSQEWDYSQLRRGDRECVVHYIIACHVIVEETTSRSPKRGSNLQLRWQSESTLVGL